MKKVILLVFSLFLLTGCEAKYKLHIGDNKIDENISIVEINRLISSTDISKELDDIITFSFDETSELGYYKVEKIIGNESSGLKLSTTYTESEFNAYAVLLKQCYDASAIIYKADSIVLNTSDTFKCFTNLNGGSISVEITTDYYVISNNADSSNKGTYTWNLKPNKNNKISLEISKTNPNPDFFKDTFDNDYMALIAIFGTVGIIVLVGYFIIKLKAKDDF